jgi:hypothetical protein
MSLLNRRIWVATLASLLPACGLGIIQVRDIPGEDSGVEGTAGSTGGETAGQGTGSGTTTGGENMGSPDSGSHSDGGSHPDSGTTHDAGSTRDAGTIRDAGSRSDAGNGGMADGGDTFDRFGVLEIYPTTSGGREWTLPDTAAQFDWQWDPETNNVTQLSTGVYHTKGGSGQIRLNIRSPQGVAWWRNVEMTGYYRETGTVSGSSELPHWELFARGERHNNDAATGSDVNGGNSAPDGTATWPGYPFGASSRVVAACLGTAYHGNIYTDGRVHFEKEISHTEGYSNNQRSESYVSGFQDPKNRWFGYKFVVYNTSAGAVHLELWLDSQGDGTWTQVAITDDTGGWKAGDSYMNGCGKSPYGYQVDQIMDWAGPWVTFRADSIAIDFKWLSVREIQPPD